MFEQLSKKQFELRCNALCPNFTDLFLEGEIYVGDGSNLISLCRDEVRKLVWIVGMHGNGIDIFRKLVHISRNQGYNHIGFTMRHTHPLHNALTHYLDLKPHFIGPQGNDYMVDLRHGGNRRLQFS